MCIRGFFVVGPTEKAAKHFAAAEEQTRKELAKYPWLRAGDVRVFGGKFDPHHLNLPFPCGSFRFPTFATEIGFREGRGLLPITGMAQPRVTLRPPLGYTGCMERICTHCHGVLAQDTKADWCPACGGSLMERAALPSTEARTASAEVDHRGIVLPRRHAVGGIITPQ